MNVKTSSAGFKARLVATCALRKDRPGRMALAVLLVVAVAALYGRFLWNPIVFDDLPLFLAGNFHIAYFGEHFEPFRLRWLPYATLAWTAQFLGLEMIGFRIGNLLLHAATTWALFIFLVQLFEATVPKGVINPQALDQRWMAFFAALLFGLHPVATYGAGYLVQRTIVMATLFSLLSMYCYVRGIARENQRWSWLSVFCYYLAVYSKEHAIMLPALILALAVLLDENWLARLKRQWHILLAYAAIAILVVLAKKSLLGSIYEIDAPQMLQTADAGDHPYLLSVLTQTWLFFKYWALWLFPNPSWMSVDMREPLAHKIVSPYLLAFCAFLIYGLLALRLLLKRGMAGLLGFALLFPWLMFMTEFSTVRIQEIFVLYRSYLWAVGVAVVMPVIVWKLTAGRAAVLSAVLALAIFPISMERLSTFSHPLLLWDDAEKLVHGRSDLPGEYRIYYNRGTEFLKIDKYDEAISDLKHSIELYPNQPAAYGNLGSAYLKKGEWDEAVRNLNVAIKGQPSPLHYHLRAMAYAAMNNWAAAREDYAMSCKLGGKGCDKKEIGPAD